MPSKKKAKSAETQDTSRLKNKTKTAAKSSSGKSSNAKISAKLSAKVSAKTPAKAPAKAPAAKSAAKKTASKPSAVKAKAETVTKSQTTKAAAKSTAAKKSAQKTAATTATKNKGGTPKSTASHKAKESIKAVTKNVAAKKPAPALAKNTAKNTAKTTAKPNKDDAAKATKTAARPASTPVANKNVKTQDIKQSAKLDAKAAAKPAPAKSTPAATSSKEKAPAQPPQKPAPTAIKASKTASKPAAKKQDADAAKLAAPVVVRPKIALASGSSAPYAAPQTPVVQNAPTAANDQNKTAPDTKAATPKPAATKNGVHRTGYRVNEYIVYPAHGVGQIIAIEEQEVAGFSLELFVINFMKDKMTLKVPLPKVLAGAIRKLADSQTVNKALETLTGRARIKRTMWSRRAQEYEAKINSGDIGSIAEVVRDLYRSETQPEQSYSERQLYEAALDRMMREIAAVQKLIDSEALKLIEQHLQRGPKRGAKTEASELSDNEVDESDLDAETEGDVEEAA